MSVLRFAARAACCACVLLLAARAASAARPYPILFVTQVPIAGRLHRPSARSSATTSPTCRSAPRGGDLCDPLSRRHAAQPDRSRPASAAQRLPGRRTRSPCASRACTGAAPRRSSHGRRRADRSSTRWRPTTGRSTRSPASARAQTADHHARSPNQPANFNNVTPIYATDGRILFTSDRPRERRARTSTRSSTSTSRRRRRRASGASTPATGDLTLLEHSPSRRLLARRSTAFGRVIFTRWDHLQRDQQADADPVDAPPTYGAFTYASEAANAATTPSARRRRGVPRAARRHAPTCWPRTSRAQRSTTSSRGRSTRTAPRTRRSTTSAATSSRSYFERQLQRRRQSRRVRLRPQRPVRTHNPTRAPQHAPDPREPVGPRRATTAIDAPEFDTHAAGQVLGIAGAPTPQRRRDRRHLGDPPRHRQLRRHAERRPATPASTATRCRSPRRDADRRARGRAAAPTPPRDARRRRTSARRTHARLALRLPHARARQPTGGTGRLRQHGATLDARRSPRRSGSGIPTTWSPTPTAPLWELDPVEVRPRPAPPATGAAAARAGAGGVRRSRRRPRRVPRSYLEERDLALIVSRDVTTRDHADRQQPFNLRVPGGRADGRRPGGTDLRRRRTCSSSRATRCAASAARLDPRPAGACSRSRMHDPRPTTRRRRGPPGSVTLALDGSMAALVPAAPRADLAAHRRLRRRRWCASATGSPSSPARSASAPRATASATDQAGAPQPTNPPPPAPQALSSSSSGGRAAGRNSSARDSRRGRRGRGRASGPRRRQRRTNPITRCSGGVGVPRKAAPPPRLPPPTPTAPPPPAPPGCGRRA